MISPTTVRNRTQRSPLNARRAPGGKEQLRKEEKTYREIMGPEFKVKAKYQHLMIDLEIDSDDILDKKLEDFRREGERNINEEILQTRYDFHHGKRIFKLQELARLKEREEAIEEEKQQFLKEQEYQRQKKNSARDVEVARLPSQHNVTRPNISGKPSSMHINVGDYASANPIKQPSRNVAFPSVSAKKESNSRLQNSSSRMGIDGRQTPRQSSMNVRADAKQRNNGGAFFLTQADVLPRTGASASRNGKIAPLLTPGHQRMISMNNSQAFSPQSSGMAPPIPSNDSISVSAADVQREREKISRFLNTKERNGRALLERESRITTRIKNMEKKAREFEKRKNADRKHQLNRIEERRSEWQERRQKVEQNHQELDDKAWLEYRKVVAQSKKRMKQELDGSEVRETQVKARQELMARSVIRENQTNSVVSEERESISATLKTLETLENRVTQHHEKARQHRLRMSQKISTNYDRVRNQGSVFKDQQAAQDLERQGRLLEKLNERKKALDKYERQKRKASIVLEERNAEKHELTKRCEEKRKEEIREIQRNIKQKDARVRRKLQQVEEQRLAEIEVRREKQRLIAEDKKKRIEFKKRTLNFKKLQVLDKHQRIEQLCDQINQNKNTFIECTRIANEIRVQKMTQICSPTKSTTSRKGSPTRNEGGHAQAVKTQA